MSLSSALSKGNRYSGRFLCDAKTSISLEDLVAGSALYSRGNELCGRSVVLATTSQLAAASALIELDGIAKRIVLCPPDIAMVHLPYVMETAAVDAVVSDRAVPHFLSKRPLYFAPCSREIAPGSYDRTANQQTEWVLLTSGSTGVPKLVVHTLESLAGAIDVGHVAAEQVTWSTFHDIRRYGGLQIFLRAILSGTSLVLPSGEESTAQFLARAASLGVSHISGTPSHWRRVLMSSAAHLISPDYIRLSGEVADQAILNHLWLTYPKARIAHTFASTEAGVAFDVNDSLAGFAATVLNETAGVQMKIEDGSLRIRSARTASRYLDAAVSTPMDEEGFVDTGDLVERRGDRYYFIGRRDGVMNVGGLKVYPEEIEAVIQRHPMVHGCLVRSKKSPITGSLVVADVVLRSMAPSGSTEASALQNDILLLCREVLSSHKVPTWINFLPALPVAASGKVLRVSS